MNIKKKIILFCFFLFTSRENFAQKTIKKNDYKKKNSFTTRVCKNALKNFPLIAAAIFLNTVVVFKFKELEFYENLKKK